MKKFVLAIDQGTTSSRAILFDEQLTIVAEAQQEIEQIFPRPGWVEHDPEDIWSSVINVCKKVILAAGVNADAIVSVGITNQRETTVVWDKDTGEPIYNAIVWQDRRTADICENLKANNFQDEIVERTGLLLDPYFSGTKIAWLLDNVEGARHKAENGSLLFGTIDSFLVWRLTKGKSHVTDATNASRTMLCNLESGKWDDTLFKIFGVPLCVMPRIMDCASDFGIIDSSIFGLKIPIRGLVGDQQASLIGQACFYPGMMKSTYGTGCFVILNTGSERVRSKGQMLTTIAYQLNGQRTYALEGSIFVAGAAIQWLRDGLKVIKNVANASFMAESSDKRQKVVFVPAFTGLGAPYWNSEAKGAIFGLTQATSPNELMRATLEAVCYQTRDLLEAMHADWFSKEISYNVLRVDGGMISNDWCMQFLSDILGTPIDCPAVLESTALGAAYLAGYQEGFYSAPDTFSKRWRLDKRYYPKFTEEEREKRYAIWKKATELTLSFN